MSDAPLFAIADRLSRRHRYPATRKRHGKSKVRSFKIWMQMRHRCYNSRVPSFRLYGGRGITICDRWRHSYENFVADMGEPPPGHSIDRIDNNGNYEPGNCRWATNAQQQLNRSNNRRITFQGETLTLTEWARRLGGSTMMLSLRLKRGWSTERALTTPIEKHVYRGRKSV